MTREKLYQSFGPILLEAIVLTIENEINILRKQIGLPEKTIQEIITAISGRLQTLPNYDWMKTNI